RHIAARIGRIAVLTGIMVIVLAALAGHWVILVIAGKEYAPAYGPMIVLSAAAAIELAGASLEALLVSRGYALRNFLLRAVPTLLAIGTLPFVVPWAGAAGAAGAVLAASMMTVAGLALATRERSR
ncbi:MAG TPA: lipopolysaccharide biosynthesis protein, partial [Croceibacterium sp.]|nr:lipopolysaccharide biosynthesis protein [Croceibacterium sp.]